MTQEQKDKVRNAIREEEVVLALDLAKSGTVTDCNRLRGFYAVAGMSQVLSYLGEEDLHKEALACMDRMMQFPTRKGY